MTSAPVPPSKRSRAKTAAPRQRSESDLDLRELLLALDAVHDGDFSVRLPVSLTGLSGKVADRFNEIVALNEELADELARTAQIVGKEGKMSRRVRIARTRGAWGGMQVSFNG